MVYFPDWSDLSNKGQLSDQTRFAWDETLMMYDRWRYYFNGEVFRERVPEEAGTHDEAPLLYPVAINLIKSLCLAQADTLFGEWEDQPITFSVRRDQSVTDADRAAIELLTSILEVSNAPATFWEIGLDVQIYGGGVLKVAPVLSSKGHIRWSRIPTPSFFPVWDPDDPDNLLEAYIMTAMTPDQARAKYGYDAKGEIVQRLEKWTPFAYENYLDGVRIDAYSGANPWGVVPIIYFPRLRSVSWFGDSLVEDLIGPQDELNMRIGDIGEALNYNAHPIRWGYNLPRNFNADNYPIGSNSFWDMGRTLGNNPPPQVGLLEIKNPVPEGAQSYIDFLITWSKTSSMAPPIAFGEDNGGGQRSGDTLEIRLWPMIKAAKRTRGYFTAGFQRAIQITGKILKQKSFSDVPTRAVASLLSSRVIPQFANILPRDQGKAVDEVVKLWSTPVPMISPETSQAVLGRGPAEVDRIREALKTFRQQLSKPQADPSQEKPGAHSQGEPKDQAA